MISLVRAGHTTLVPVVGAEVATVGVAVALAVAMGVAVELGVAELVAVGVATGPEPSAALAVAAMNPVVARVKETAVMAARLRLLRFVLLMLTT